MYKRQVLIHAGIHFNAILPWLATVAMGVNVISGMVGKLLLDRSRRHVQGPVSYTHLDVYKRQWVITSSVTASQNTACSASGRDRPRS